MSGDIPTTSALYTNMTSSGTVGPATEHGEALHVQGQIQVLAGGGL